MSFWAFLVAAGNYNEFDQLIFFEDSVKKLGQILEKKGNYKVTILSTEATEEKDKPGLLAIKHRYRTFLSEIKSQLNPHDTILIYFMGHGGSSDRTEKDYFLPYNAMKGLDKEDSAVPLDWLETQMKMILGSKEIIQYNIFFFIDACRLKDTTLGWSGLKFIQTSLAQISEPPRRGERQPPAGISWIYSCQEGHLGHVVELNGHDQAIFTYHFIKFLKEARKHVSFRNLFYHCLIEKVPETASTNYLSQ
ncbi:MAG: caspase family protein, partial [Candidatus Hodarchaeota archaeon]